MSGSGGGGGGGDGLTPVPQRLRIGTGAASFPQQFSQARKPLRVLQSPGALAQLSGTEIEPLQSNNGSYKANSMQCTASAGLFLPCCARTLPVAGVGQVLRAVLLPLTSGLFDPAPASSASQSKEPTGMGMTRQCIDTSSGLVSCACTWPPLEADCRKPAALSVQLTTVALRVSRVLSAGGGKTSQGNIRVRRWQTARLRVTSQGRPWHRRRPGSAPRRAQCACEAPRRGEGARVAQGCCRRVPGAAAAASSALHGRGNGSCHYGLGAACEEGQEAALLRLGHVVQEQVVCGTSGWVVIMGGGGQAV